MTATILNAERLRELWPTKPRPWTVKEEELHAEMTNLLAVIHAGYSGEGVQTLCAEIRLKEVRREMRECAVEKLLASL